VLPSTASAIFALKAGMCFRRDRLSIVFSWFRQKRASSEAETPPIPLANFRGRFFVCAPGFEHQRVYGAATGTGLIEQLVAQTGDEGHREGVLYRLAWRGPMPGDFVIVGPLPCHARVLPERLHQFTTLLARSIFAILRPLPWAS